MQTKKSTLTSPQLPAPNRFHLKVEEQLSLALAKRSAEGKLRRLPDPVTGIDFSSNDYLGFARSPALKIILESLLPASKDLRTGSTGSRLLHGNSLLAEELENIIAGFHSTESALLFNSGYDANLGLLSCIADRHDTILYDELCHASIHDGIKLSRSNSWKFRHNDLNDAESKLQKAKGNIYVITESVFSMDGDFAPLTELAQLCEKYGAGLIVDEAHATGIFGNRGEGRVVELGLSKKTFARIHTFGKALGTHGAAVLGSAVLKQYLINYARSFIYTTALPDPALLSIKAAYKMLSADNVEAQKLKSNINFFDQTVAELNLPMQLNSKSPIQALITGGNFETRKKAEALQKAGFDVRPILSPTVAAGSERIRICLHAYNSETEIKNLLSKIASLLKSDKVSGQEA